MLAAVEKQPTGDEFETARRQARADATEKARTERERPDVDQPLVDESSTYSFAPEDLRAEYERVYEETLDKLRHDRD